jgi:molecular chaperone GrpE
MKKQPSETPGIEGADDVAARADRTDATAGTSRGVGDEAPDAFASDDAGPDRDGQEAGSEGGPTVAELESARRELDATRDRHLRLAAEYDNYRKRTERERTESYARAQAQLVEKLLDVLDDLHRVTGMNPESTSSEALLEGVHLVERKLYRALEAAGLETIEAEGHPFDPTVHEALVMLPTEEKDEDDTVAQVFQPGYLFKGTLLRPARVQVKRFGG